MLSMAALCVAMTVGSVELEPAPKAPSPAVTNFDALPEVPAISDDARVKRFIGAFTGGLVGLAAGFALVSVANTSTPFCPLCISPGNVMLGALAPLLAVGGAWLAFELLGGDAGLLVPAVALAPAMLISLGLLAIAREADQDGVLRLMPYAISAGVFFAGGAAFALDYRARQLNELGAAAKWGSASRGRVGLTALISTLTGGAAVITSGLLFIAGGYQGAGVAMMLISALVGSVGAASAAWGVHRGMNGRGSFGAALAGMGVALAVSGAGLGLWALAQGPFGSAGVLRSNAALTIVAELAVLSAALAPVIALEVSHTNAVQESLPKISFGVSPTPNGGMIAAGMRF